MFCAMLLRTFLLALLVAAGAEIPREANLVLREEGSHANIPCQPSPPSIYSGDITRREWHVESPHSGCDSSEEGPFLTFAAISLDCNGTSLYCTATFEDGKTVNSTLTILTVFLVEASNPSTTTATTISTTGVTTGNTTAGNTIDNTIGDNTIGDNTTGNTIDNTIIGDNTIGNTIDNTIGNNTTTMTGVIVGPVIAGALILFTPTVAILIVVACVLKRRCCKKKWCSCCYKSHYDVKRQQNDIPSSTGREPEVKLETFTKEPAIPQSNAALQKEDTKEELQKSYRIQTLRSADTTVNGSSASHMATPPQPTAFFFRRDDISIDPLNGAIIMQQEDESQPKEQSVFTRTLSSPSLIANAHGHYIASSS